MAGCWALGAFGFGAYRSSCHECNVATFIMASPDFRHHQGRQGGSLQSSVVGWHDIGDAIAFSCRKRFNISYTRGEVLHGLINGTPVRITVMQTLAPEPIDGTSLRDKRIIAAYDVGAVSTTNAKFPTQIKGAQFTA